MRVDFDQRADVTAVSCSLAPLVPNPVDCKYYTRSHCASLCVHLTHATEMTKYGYDGSSMNFTIIIATKKSCEHLKSLLRSY